MTIVTVALDGLAASLANYSLECGHSLLLRRSRTGHVEDLFFHNRAVQIVHSVAERDLGERQPHAHPIGSEMVNVIEVNAAYGEVAKLFNSRRRCDMGEHCRLRLEGKRNKAGEAAALIL